MTISSPLNGVIQNLRAGFTPGRDGMTDGELLARFLASRDEDALAALVRRHATMVWGVCRRFLNHHDAEDAFQATYLVLVRKAPNVPGHAVANWLYGVARQTAIRARAIAAKQGQRETQVVNMPEAIETEVRDAELQVAVEDELSRLPDHYRGVIVLCDLEGMTRKEAARQLGIPEGSAASRLARARALMAKRLAQKGIALSGGSIATVLSSESASAAPALVSSTIDAVILLTAGKAANVVSTTAVALAESMEKAMFASRLKATLSVVLILGLVATGATLQTFHLAAGQETPTPESPVKEGSREQPPRKAKPEAEEFIAWGKEVGGLQAGLSILDRDNIKIGENATAVVRLRNVGKKEITVSVWPYDLHVVDSRGKPVRSERPPEPLYEIIPVEIKVPAGEAVVVWKKYLFRVESVDAVPIGTVNRYTIYLGSGTYGAGLVGFVKEHPTLSAGTVEFKVKEKLSVEQAKKLLPEAAGIGNVDFRTLTKDNPRPEAVKNKPLSFVLLSLPPPDEKDRDADKEFRILGEDLKVSDILEAMWISKDKGYASFLQPKYITDCTCKSTLKRAEGVVTFKSDFFAGQIPFVAEATKDGWVITEFRLPRYKTKVVRGEDGVWEQKALTAQARIPDEVKIAPAPPEPELEDPAQTLAGMVYGPLRADGSRDISYRQNAVGKRVVVEGIAWGGPQVIHQGGSIYIRGVDLTKARGNPVRVTGTLRLQPEIATRSAPTSRMKAYYYIEATTFEPLDAVTDPYFALAKP